MVYRVYVEKRPGLDNEARGLKNEFSVILGINTDEVRVLNRYDASDIDESDYERAVKTVFSEPQLDITYTELPKADYVFATEYLPGQFDQRADSAEQCIQIMTCGNRPKIRSAKVYLINGKLTEEELNTIKKYLINPVEAREASLETRDTLEDKFDVPADVAVIDGFTELDREGLNEFVSAYGLAMDTDDAMFCRDYFRSEGRNPTITEIRMIDTYWSDHCRHTTFLTTIDNVTFEDELLQKTYDEYCSIRKKLGRTKPVTLMDIATLATKYLKSEGLLKKLDESDEINACTVKINIDVDGKTEPWLLLFKNETHNHPTEIEPFGGAATCIGGAIRDPLSGRSYVYAAMRVTGAADPTVPISETIEGKLPQRKLVQTAAAGYSSYGNQIGLATGIVDEIYHPGYAAKRMEIGAVLGAVPEKNVIREEPVPGDIIILLGGRTGRDGIGGATGSSKAHNAHSVETCGAEVQKGNAPEERKLQRLFRNPEAAQMIIRCNDFGAGGVSVAVGELADGLDIRLDAVPKKYEGLDGTELAISESQERMAVAVHPENAQRFMQLADSENLEATIVATVTEEARMRMTWRGKTIVDVSREFLNSNGAEKHITISAKAPEKCEIIVTGSFAEEYKKLLSDLNCSSHRGLSERFDSTIGAGTVLMPFGGKNQRTPIQCMVNKIPLEKGHTDSCSFMAWGYNPFISEKSPYHGAYLAVVESVSKLIAAGASFEDVYLTFQEYFEKPGKSPERWGKPLSALLGAFRAQVELGIAAIGGKDSMSGSFEKLDVPPTLVSFAVTTGLTSDVISDDFKKAGHYAVLLSPEYGEDGLPTAESLKALYKTVNGYIRSGKVYAAYTPAMGGIAEAVYKMSIGAGFGFDYSSDISVSELFAHKYGSFILETDDSTIGKVIGTITDKGSFTYGSESVAADVLDKAYESVFESVYPLRESGASQKYEAFSYEKRAVCRPHGIAVPKVMIPVFPGTNCEYDSARAVRDAGAEPEIFVINNLTSDGIARSTEEFASKVNDSQMIFVPGGFSGGDEPDGSGKFIMAFFRNTQVKDAVHNLLDNRDGLMCGICNGFQALIKLGLVPFGHIIDTDENCPTLSFNTIARHQSKLVRIRISSVLSPWLSFANVGDVFTVPISHGEGRFLASDEVIKDLASKGQIATQYVDLDGNVTDDIRYTPNDSICAIEGITSPDGRVFGKMGHSERIGNGLYKNVDGIFNMRMFESAVKYFM